jgi:hypothetical protein
MINLIIWIAIIEVGVLVAVCIIDLLQPQAAQIIKIVVGIVVLLVLFWLVFPSLATAGERGDWFKSLKVPGTVNGSCCDVADCKRTIADYKGGQWVAKVWGYQRMIPPNVVLQHPKSLDGEAYVCARNASPLQRAEILCFIPPDMGY